MESVNRILIFIPFLLISCLYIPKSNTNIEKKYILPETYKQKIRYLYLPKVCGTYDSSLDFRTTEIGSILLLPFFWINFVNGDFRDDYFETFLLFQNELAKELIDKS